MDILCGLRQLKYPYGFTYSEPHIVYCIDVPGRIPVPSLHRSCHDIQISKTYAIGSDTQLSSHFFPFLPFIFHMPQLPSFIHSSHISTPLLGISVLVCSVIAYTIAKMFGFSRKNEFEVEGRVSIKPPLVSSQLFH